MSNDWRTACEHQVEDVLKMASYLGRGIDHEDEILVRIGNFAHWVKKGWEPNPSTFKMIAANACKLLGEAGWSVWDVDRAVDILCRKQHDYGPGNISKFGTIGIMVRMSDKAERLRNLRARGTSPQNESLVDTIFDILGYSIVALMWMEGTFLLDLKLVVEEKALESWRSDPVVTTPEIIHDPSPAQLEEFFAAPGVSYEPHYRGEQKLPKEFYQGFCG